MTTKAARKKQAARKTSATHEASGDAEVASKPKAVTFKSIVGKLLRQPRIEQDDPEGEDVEALVDSARKRANGAPVYLCDGLLDDNVFMLYRPLTAAEWAIVKNPMIPVGDATHKAIIGAALLHPSCEVVAEQCKHRPLLAETLSDEVLRVSGMGRSYAFGRIL